MEGVNDTIEEGILPRTAKFLFAELKRVHKKFTIEISSLEIYCDNIRDLFSESN